MEDKNNLKFIMALFRRISLILYLFALIMYLFIFQLLKHATVHMMDARSRQHGMMGNPDTAQLLLIVSDGRGLFMEGMETVKSAVRQARESNIFSVFVIIDNPQAKVQF